MKKKISKAKSQFLFRKQLILLPLPGFVPLVWPLSFELHNTEIFIFP